MKIMMLTVGCFLCLGLHARTAETFETSDERTRAYIVDQLRTGIRVGDIAIVQPRTDELSREEHLIPFGQRDVLGLQYYLRMVKALKGDLGIPRNGLFYIYWRTSRLRNDRAPYPHYMPSWSSDDLMRLVILEKQHEPLKERMGNRHTAEFTPFFEDGMKMETAVFLDKYSLQSVFSNRVCRLVGSCAFVVEYPEPVIEPRPDVRYDVEYFNQCVRAERAKNPDWRFKDKFILSNREASEIVFIAYLLDGKDGATKYAEAAKGDPLLLPIDKPDFQTELGRRLYAAATGNPDEKDRETGEGHGHHHPVMGDEERAAWQPPPNTNSNGNVWSYLMPNRTVKTIEFFTDREVRVSTNGWVSESFQWFKEDGAVTANSSRWFPSPDGKTILEEARHRVWHRGSVPPPPDPKLTAALTAEGTRWEAEDGGTFYVFRSDGTCTEEGRLWTPNAAWEPWYGRTACIRHAGRSVDPVLARLSPDGGMLTREDGKVYRRRAAAGGAAGR